MIVKCPTLQFPNFNDFYSEIKNGLTHQLLAKARLSCSKLTLLFYLKHVSAFSHFITLPFVRICSTKPLLI